MLIQVFDKSEYTIHYKNCALKTTVFFLDVSLFVINFENNFTRKKAVRGL